MRRKRSKSQAAVAVGVGSVIGFGLSTTAGASGPFDAHTWNLAMGNVNYAWANGTHGHKTREYVLARVASENPWTAGYTEMCESQYDWLNDGNVAGRLPNRGYKGGMVRTNGNATQCPGAANQEWRVSSVFTKGGLGSNCCFQTALQPVKSYIDGERDTRYLFCNNATPFSGFSYFGCVVHTATGTPWSLQQSSMSHDDIYNNPYAGFEIVVGDFNHEPFDQCQPPSNCAPYYSFPAQLWNSTHVEGQNADPLKPSRSSPTMGNVKVDYTWAGRAFADLRELSDCYRPVDATNGPMSDHWYCQGKFWLR